MFIAHTAMTWPDFLEMAKSQFNKTSDVSLGYRFSGRGEARAVTQLDCVADWDVAMTKMREKIESARSRKVTLELRNTVCDALLT
jgi:hypothetical protein